MHGWMDGWMGMFAVRLQLLVVWVCGGVASGRWGVFGLAVVVLLAVSGSAAFARRRCPWRVACIGDELQPYSLSFKGSVRVLVLVQGTDCMGKRLDVCGPFAVVGWLVGMCVCVYMDTCVCGYMSMYLDMCVCVCWCLYVNAYMSIMYIYVYICIYIYIFIYICIYIYIYTYVFIYIDR